MIYTLTTKNTELMIVVYPTRTLRILPKHLGYYIARDIRKYAQSHKKYTPIKSIEVVAYEVVSVFLQKFLQRIPLRNVTIVVISGRGDNRTFSAAGCVYSLVHLHTRILPIVFIAIYTIVADRQTDIVLVMDPNISPRIIYANIPSIIV